MGYYNRKGEDTAIGCLVMMIFIICAAPFVFLVKLLSNNWDDMPEDVKTALQIGALVVIAVIAVIALLNGMQFRVR